MNLLRNGRLYLPREVESKVIKVPVVGIEVVEIGLGEPKWAQEMARYLDMGELPADKRGFMTLLLRCICPQEAQYVLAEVHERACWNHSRGRALARKVMWADYYLPHALKDVKEFVKRCAKCQMFAPISHFLLVELTSIMSPWSFA
ncbi:uncharacterized protein LOC121247360 [Juglans microcarpa x Juglans regia]|uniref:uncharacterized protein LOC121247360 n=1 Tax=Juglans microcarpa x Juglans regia TaxID=2249226 RepID=UPI001B7E4162|nr:uncharacterized protein LOC121247360 [Juglans microcarpa x Juglans regia]